MDETQNKVETQEDEKLVQLSIQIEQENENTEQDSLENIEKQLQESEMTVKSSKSKKKKILNGLFFALNIVLVAIILFVQISKEQISPLSELVAILRPWNLLLLVLGLVLISVIESLLFNIQIKALTKKNRLFLSYKVQGIGRYYDNITPMGSGGQPFQIFYLKTHGIDAADSISIPMRKYIILQFAWMLFSILVIIISLCMNLAGNSIIGILGIVGTVANATLVLFIVLLSVSKTIGKKLVVAALKLLQKIRIVKNYEKQYTKVMKVVSDYQTVMRGMLTNFWEFFWQLLLGLLKNVVVYSLPFFIYLCFFDFNFEIYLELLCMTALVDMVANVIPIPGGGGVTELSFTALFAECFGGIVFWAMLFWRLVNYYFYLAQGLCIIIYDYLIGNKKFKWQQRKWELELESEKFKREQLKSYKKKSKNVLKIK